MSIHDRLAALGEELHLSGFGSELTEAVKRVAHLFADEIHSLGAGAAPDVKALADQVIGKLNEQMTGALGELKADFEKAFEQANANIDQRVEAKFAELLAKAAVTATVEPEAPAQA